MAENSMFIEIMRNSVTLGYCAAEDWWLRGLLADNGE